MNLQEHNQRGSDDSALQLRDLVPFQLVSLYDMVEFPFSLLKTLLSGMQAIQTELDEKGDDVLEEQQADLFQRVREYEGLCRHFGIDVHDCVIRLQDKILNPSQFKRSVGSFWMEMRNRTGDELKKHRWIYIPESEAKWLNNEMLFGPDVFEKFRDAREDLKLAGNCMATANYTACVFHLMRVVEHGLRKIARQLRVPFPATYELKTWERLLKEIEEEIKKIIGQPKTPARLRRLKFYNPIPLEFRFFKDAWRNHVMHCRAEYDEHQAKSIMVHVESLMRHIAKGKAAA